MSISMDTHFVRTTIDLFENKADDRSQNDANNKAREAAVDFLMGSDKAASEKFTNDPQVGSRWKIVEASLREALKSIPESHAGETDLEFSHVEHRGGRSKNFDFDSVYRHKVTLEQKTKSVEFKFGNSIYDQPQFLSIYATPAYFITSESQPFSEFFYDNYGSSLATLANTKLPERAFYLSKIFGTSRGVHPFFTNLHKYKTSNDSNKEALKNISDNAIEGYLKTFESQENHLDYVAINAMFRNQVTKFFISWSYETMSANVENFTEKDMKVTSEFSLKQNSNGQYNSLVFKNLNENRIEALLRWKNHACILGPAWQVKLQRS